MMQGSVTNYCQMAAPSINSIPVLHLDAKHWWDLHTHVEEATVLINVQSPTVSIPIAYFIIP